MNPLRAHLLLALLFIAPVSAGHAANLELMGFLTESAGETHLNLRITNRGTKPQTVLTQNPFLFGSSSNGRRNPSLGIDFGFFGVGEADGRSWKFVPSLPTLGPVTLYKGETATMSFRLEPDLAKALEDPDTGFHVSYTIAEDFAKRFHLWSGTLELNETVRALRGK